MNSCNLVSDKTKTIVMKKIIILPLLALIITSGVLILNATTPDPATTKGVVVEQPTTPVIELTQELSSYAFGTDSHDFGEVKAGTKAKHTFWFTNTGTEDLILASVKPSCSCTASEFTKEAVAPGEKGFVKVEYAAKKAGVFKKTIILTANTDPVRKVLSINGEVVN